MFQANKPKSAGKIIVPVSEQLTKEVIDTLNHIAQIVGATLGPGGRQVLIERPELYMKPIVTKDGVTVIKHLGYYNAIKQIILEAVRDAAVSTAQGAGDGTTTATILAAAIANSISKFLNHNVRVSPQRIVRELQAIVPDVVKLIDKYTLKVTGENYYDILFKVATLSANGDEELAKSILEALDIVGEEGNITILELPGESKCIVEKVHGYHIEQGYEESCRNLAHGFINDRSGTKVVMKNPLFLLYDGVIHDIQQVLSALSAIGDEIVKLGRSDNGVVLVAHGFSDSVLGDLHFNWNASKSTVKVFPLLAPRNAIHNSATHFLYDLQAYVGAPVFNPIDNPPSNLVPSELIANNRATEFECQRYKSNVIAIEDHDAISLRVEELKEQMKNPESEYELKDLEVRIGKLTSGIARLSICAPSAGESREKRDRAEDAWMAVKGAIKHGALPGGGFVLVKLSSDLSIRAEKLSPGSPKRMAMEILSEALLKPVEMLYANYGYLPNEIILRIKEMILDEEKTFDIAKQEWVDKYDLLDSAPAVIEAIRNSISIASLLGTLGGIIAFRRDEEEDRKEADAIRKFELGIGIRNPNQE